MSENKHTDGPWAIEHFNAPIADTGDYDCVTRVIGPAKEAVVEFFNGNDTDEANARLIAAAPELLEKLDQLTLVVGLTAIKHELQRAALQQAVDEARAIVAKATGR